MSFLTPTPKDTGTRQDAPNRRVPPCSSQHKPGCFTNKPEQSPPKPGCFTNQPDPLPAPEDKPACLTNQPDPLPASPRKLALWLNLLMAASAAGWVIVTSKLLFLPLDGVLVALAFVLAVAFYTRDRLDESEQSTDATTMPQRTAWVQRYANPLRRLVWLNFGMAIILLMIRPAALPPILAGLGFALTYTIRWLPWRGRRVGWKHLPAMKMPFVAILWTVLTVITPATVYDKLWQVASWRVAASVCLLIMIQILINDLRDLTGDQKSGTDSLPVLLGDPQARRIGYLLALIAALLVPRPLALPLTALYSALLLWRYRRQADEQWRFWIEVQGVVPALLAMWTSL